MTWHYQVMKKTRKDYPADQEYAIYEFYEPEEGSLDEGNWTKDPIAASSDTLKGVNKELYRMTRDLLKYGVRDYHTGKLLDEGIP